ncbi:MAG: glycosyltransferase [Bacteroidales bacterium]
MIKNRDIIVTGIQPWDIEIGSNCKNLALEFAKDNRVLYINAPTDRISMLRERKSAKMLKRKMIRMGLEPSLVQIAPNLWNLYPPTITESINWVPAPFIFNYLNKMNAVRFSKDIDKATKALHFKNPILFNDSSMFLGAHLKELLKPQFYIYYIRDYLIKNPYWKKHGVKIEPVTISKANLVVTNSQLYADYAIKYNPESYMVGQGCDTEMFDQSKNEIQNAPELKDIPKPIVGYVGYLSSRRLSIEILEYIANELKSWSIVLVGPQDEQFMASSLHSIKNVYFLGSKEPSSLPGFIKCFDVAINPQLVNDATIGNYPRKIDEYLTMGKPVVATKTLAMDYFKDYVYLGNNKEDFVTLINKARQENNVVLEQARYKFGKSHNWENNVKEIYSRIVSVSKKKNIDI